MLGTKNVSTKVSSSLIPRDGTSKFKWKPLVQQTLDSLKKSLNKCTQNLFSVNRISTLSLILSVTRISTRPHIQSMARISTLPHI